MNTKPSRPALGDQEMYWCKNFMPLGKSNLRALWDHGPAIYTQSGGKTIYGFAFFNLATLTQEANNQLGDEYLVVFCNDGSGTITDLTANTTVLTFPTATFNTSFSPGVAQWGNNYLIIVSQLESGNGYFIFDGGSFFYQAGTIGPLVSITNSGKSYTSAPTITTSGGSGSGATFSTTIENGTISSITVTNPGSGYNVNDATALVFSGGGNGTSTAIITTSVSNQQIVGYGIANAGAGYTSEITLKVVGGGGTGAEVTAQVTGNIGSVTVTNGGAGYSGAVITATGSGGSGSGATFTVVGNSAGSIVSVTVSSPGSGYQTPVTLSASGGGTGFSATATVVNGTVTGTLVTATGQGYTSPATVIVSDPSSNLAQATVSLMPFGVQGTSAETYSAIVWVLDGPKRINSAPGDPSDFSAADGSGVAASSDSFLRQSYISILQSNGFLYTIADSSINSITGVQTSGSPAITTYSNQNIDPQIGSPWRDSCTTYSRALLLTNAFGIQALYGGAVQKISTPMDGILTTLQNLGSFQPSTAIATIFGVHVALTLTPVVDLITGVEKNLIVMWDGKRWWVADQSINLTYIRTREINSAINAYGTDGTSIYPLFTTPSTAITKTVQSKLWTEPNPFITKKWERQLGIFQNYSTTDNVTVNVALDNESNQASYAYTCVVPPTGTGTYVQLQGCDGAGIMFGLTLESNGEDFAIISYSATGQDLVKQV